MDDRGVRRWVFAVEDGLALDSVGDPVLDLVGISDAP
jgi:hypothetical protein